MTALSSESAFAWIARPGARRVALATWTRSVVWVFFCSLLQIRLLWGPWSAWILPRWPWNVVAVSGAICPIMAIVLLIWHDQLRRIGQATAHALVGVAVASSCVCLVAKPGRLLWLVESGLVTQLGLAFYFRRGSRLFVAFLLSFLAWLVSLLRSRLFDLSRPFGGIVSVPLSWLVLQIAGLSTLCLALVSIIGLRQMRVLHSALFRWMLVLYVALFSVCEFILVNEPGSARMDSSWPLLTPF